MSSAQPEWTKLPEYGDAPQLWKSELLHKPLRRHGFANRHPKQTFEAEARAADIGEIEPLLRGLSY